MGCADFALGKMDIVCGRGKKYEANPGNQLFRKMIQEYATTYSSTGTTRPYKSVVIRTILTQLKRRDIRFVKQLRNEKWVVLQQKEISVKIGHALRDVNAVHRKQMYRAQRRLEKKGSLTRKQQSKPQKIVPNKLGFASHTGATRSKLKSASALEPVSGLISERSALESKCNLRFPATPEGPNKTFSDTPNKVEFTAESDDCSSGRLDPFICSESSASDLSHTFSLLDISLVMLASEVPIATCASSNSITSEGWLCDLIMQE